MQDEVDCSLATTGTATGMVTGTGKLAAASGKFLYDVMGHAAKIDFLGDPKNVGELPDELRSQLELEIQQDLSAVKAVIKNPEILGKAIITQFKEQLKGIDTSLQQGDYFGAGKEAGEMAFEVATTGASLYGVAGSGLRVASKLSIRGLDLAVNSTKFIGNGCWRARNNSVSSSKPRVNTPSHATSSSPNATNYNAHTSINKKLRALQDAQK